MAKKKATKKTAKSASTPAIPAAAAGFVRDGDAALSEQIFHITETQAEAVVEPDSVADDLAWKTISAVAG